MKWIGWIVFIMVVFVLLGCIGLGVPADVMIALGVGWIFYLHRVIPEVHVNGMGVVTAVVCLVGFVPLLHLFLSWLKRSWGRTTVDEATVAPPQPWHFRWTAAAIGITLLMFIAGIAAAGLVHQTGWLITATSPFLNPGGEAARRAQLTNNLKQIGLGAHEIMTKEGRCPAGCTVSRDGEVLHSWVTVLLPFMEHQSLFDRIDLELPWNHPDNASVCKERLYFLEHPAYSDRQHFDSNGFALINYAANIHVMGGTRRLTEADIKDGTSSTFLPGEIADRFPAWGKPGNWRDPAHGVNHRPDGFGGPSPGGINFLFVDGSVRFIKDTIDPQVLEALGTPDGGEVLSSDQY